MRHHSLTAGLTRGFTIVELLVVIAIISLMISLLLPSLGQAKEVGRRTMCASNQRQTLVTHNTYANDFKQNYTPHLYTNNLASYSFIANNLATPYQHYLDGYSTNLTAATTTNAPGWYSAWPTYCEWGYEYANALMLSGYTNGGYSYMACVPTFNPAMRIAPAVEGGWDIRDVYHSAYVNLPDGKSPKYVPFFAYNGPGCAPEMFVGGSNFPNPIDIMPIGNTIQYVSCLRPDYGYIGNDPTKKTYGSFKLIDCPNDYQTNPGPVFGIYSPHGTTLQYMGQGNTLPPIVHYRNYGWTDGHVAGLDSRLGY